MNKKIKEMKGKIKEKEGELKGKSKEMKGDVKKRLKENEGEIKKIKEDIEPSKSEEKVKIEENENLKEEKGDVSRESSSGDEFRDMASKTKSGAEKVLSDLISGFREKQEELGEKISEYTDEGGKPLTDVLENDNNIIIRMDLPGVKKNDVEVHLMEDGVDVIAMFPGKMEKGNYIKRERNYGKITRTIDLSKKVKGKDAYASFKNCTLTIELPKLVKDRYKMKIE